MAKNGLYLYYKVKIYYMTEDNVSIVDDFVALRDEVKVDSELPKVKKEKLFKLLDMIIERYVDEIIGDRFAAS